MIAVTRSSVERKHYENILGLKESAGQYHRLTIRTRKANLHESFTLQSVQVVGSAVQPFPLRVEDRVGHLPPGPAVQQQSQAHHTGHGDQHRIDRQVPRIHL